jgi:hypothetical protein
MQTVKMTRRSKVGFGWNTCPTGNGTQIKPTTSPDFVGTIKTVLHDKNTDPNYKSMQSTYKTTAWFIKVNGKWHKILTEQMYFEDLVTEHYENRKEFLYDSIEIEIE